MKLEEAKRILYGPGVDSYNRMERALLITEDMAPGDRLEVIGHAWSCCDSIADHVDDLRRILKDASPEDRIRMMTDEERALRDKLPIRFTVWRGCYPHNVEGLCWSLDKATAERFPYLHRYRHAGVEPLLVQGAVDRESAVYFGGRNEAEIVSADVQIVEVTNMAPYTGESVG